MTTELTDAQIEAIAEKAARKALEMSMSEAHLNELADKVQDRFVLRFGWAALKKLAWLAGFAIVGLVLWLAGKDALPK